jgi:hypothetical protein
MLVAPERPVRESFPPHPSLIPMQRTTVVLFTLVLAAGCDADRPGAPAQDVEAAGEPETAPDEFPFTVDTQTVVIPDAGP